MRKFAISIFEVVVSTMIASKAHATVVSTLVDLELQLLVDVSGSVDQTEFALQRDGYAAAFASASIQTAILAGAIGSIAAQLIYWSSDASQSIAVGWTLIDSIATANAFSAAIGATTDPTVGNTAIGSAINFGFPLFATNTFDGTRQVMDVSGDGAQSGSLVNTSDARDAALAAGIDTINGLVILGEPGLLSFYTNNVIGGTGAFVLTAASFDDFASAIDTKLMAEITDTSPVPLPAAAWFLLVAVGGLFGYGRVKRAA